MDPCLCNQGWVLMLCIRFNKTTSLIPNTDLKPLDLYYSRYEVSTIFLIIKKSKSKSVSFYCSVYYYLPPIYHHTHFPPQMRTLIELEVCTGNIYMLFSSSITVVLICAHFFSLSLSLSSDFLSLSSDSGMAWLQLLTRKAMKARLLNFIPRCRSPTYEPYIATSDISGDKDTGILTFACSLAHRGQVVCARVGNTGMTDTPLGETYASVSVIDMIRDFEKESGVRVSQAIHLGDHYKVMANLRGSGYSKTPANHIKLIRLYQNYGPAYIRASPHLPRDYNRFTNHLARLGRNMKPGNLSVEELDVIIKNRVQDLKKKNISQARIFKFRMETNSYLLFTNRIGITSSVISIGKERPRQVVLSFMKTFHRLPVENDKEELVGRQTLLSGQDIRVLGVSRLAVENDKEELVERQTLLSGKDIRVLGVSRLSKLHVLVSEMGGIVVEFCKIIVVAGVGSLTLVDDRMLSKGSFLKSFFSPDDKDGFRGKSLAEACCDALRKLNPLVQVSVQKGDLSSFDEDFYDKFNTVIVSCCSLKTKILINEKCRRRQKPIAFYAVDCRDSSGEIFVDLQNYTYAQESSDEIIECQLQYPSFEEAVVVRWCTLPRRLSKLYFALRVIENFEEAEGRRAGSADLSRILKLKKELCEEQSFRESLIPDALLKRLLVGSRKENPPVCAIIGRILCQEVINAISGEGPLNNFYFFEALDGNW